MKRVLAPFLVITLIVLSMPSTTSFVVPAQAQNEFSVWTDKPSYSIGETVVIQVSPTPALGVDYWLVIYRPDGSQERIDLTPGQDTIPIAAGPQIGQYRVELWTQVVAPDTTAELAAYCTYEVVKEIKPDAMYRGDVVEIFPPDYAVVVEEVLQDPTGTLKKPDRTWVSVYDAGQVIGNMQVGSYVEVYGELYSTTAGPNGYQISVYQSYHYIKEIPPPGPVEYQVNLFSAVQGGPDDIGAIIKFDGVSHKTPSSVSVTPNTWHTIAVLPYTMPYVFVNWEISGPSQIKDPYAQTTEVYVDNPGYIKAWYKTERLPDLTVYGLRLSPENPNSGDKVTFYATIANQGDAVACGPYWRITLDGTTLSELGTFVCAEPGWTLDVSYPDWTAVQGNHEVCWIVDPTNAIAESNEDNNKACMRFTVGTKPPPAPQVDVWTDKGGRGPNVSDGTYQVGDTVKIFYSVNEYVAFASLAFSGPRQSTENLGTLQAGTFSYDFRTQAGDSGHWSVTFSVCASGDPGLGLCNPATMAKDTVTFEVLSQLKTVGLWFKLTLQNVQVHSANDAISQKVAGIDCRPNPFTVVPCFSVQQNFWIYNSKGKIVLWGQNIMGFENSPLESGVWFVSYDFEVWRDLKHELIHEQYCFPIPTKPFCVPSLYLTSTRLPESFYFFTRIFNNGSKSRLYLDNWIQDQPSLGDLYWDLPSWADCPCYVVAASQGKPPWGAGDATLAELAIVGIGGTCINDYCDGASAVFDKGTTMGSFGAKVGTSDGDWYEASLGVICQAGHASCRMPPSTAEKSDQLEWHSETREFTGGFISYDEGVYISSVATKSGPNPILPQSGRTYLFARLDPPDVIAHLTAYDERGHVTGYDPSDGNFLADIPNSLSFQLDSGEYVVIGDPVGVYRLLITAISNGDYHLLLVRTVKESVKTVDGTMSQGQSKQFSLDADTMNICEATMCGSNTTWQVILGLGLLSIIASMIIVRRYRSSRPRVRELLDAPKIIRS